jgi:hypothetical protein
LPLPVDPLPALDVFGRSGTVVKVFAPLVVAHFALYRRSADGRTERFSDLANELVKLNVNVIVTRGTPAAFAAKKATDRIPLVMAANGDP